MSCHFGILEKRDRLAPLIAAAAAPWECAIRCQSVHRLGRSSSRCDPQVEWQKLVRYAALAFGHHKLHTPAVYNSKNACKKLAGSPMKYTKDWSKNMWFSESTESLALPRVPKEHSLLFYCSPREGKKLGDKRRSAQIEGLMCACVHSRLSKLLRARERHFINLICDTDKKSPDASPNFSPAFISAHDETDDRVPAAVYLIWGGKNNLADI